MLSVFICENNTAQRKKIEDIIANHLISENYNFELSVSTSNPMDILNYFGKNIDVKGVYFLDITLNGSMDGIELAIQIRKRDPDAKIIFVTKYSGYLNTIFYHRIEALDYILKHDDSDLEKRICECLNIAHSYHNRKNQSRISIKVDGKVRIFDLKDIMFFETTDKSHKTNLHLSNEIISVYMSLNDLELLSTELIRIHRAFLINRFSISSIDYSNREITFYNGEKCYISVRKMNLLKSIISEV